MEFTLGYLFVSRFRFGFIKIIYSCFGSCIGFIKIMFIGFDQKKKKKITQTYITQYF